MARPKNSKVASVAELKSTSDEAICLILKKWGYKQSFFYSDILLITNYTAVILAALVFAYDYKVGYAAARPLSGPGTVLFFVLQGLALIWYLFIAKKAMYYGTNGDQTVRITTSVKRAVPIYNVTLRTDDPPRIDQVAIDFPKFITESGKVEENKMSEWLKPLIEGKNKETKKEK